MTPAETLGVLSYFAAAWPWAEVGDRTAEVWAEACTGVDAELAHTAARRLARTEDRPPSIARFRAEVDKLDRDRRPALPAGPRPLGFKTNAAVARALRAGFAAAGTFGTPHGHDHRDGTADNCEPCNRSTVERQAVAGEVMDAIRDELRRGA